MKVPTLREQDLRIISNIHQHAEHCSTSHHVEFTVDEFRDVYHNLGHLAAAVYRILTRDDDAYSDDPSAAGQYGPAPLTRDETDTLLALIYRHVQAIHPGIDAWSIAQNAVYRLANDPCAVLPDEERP